jgi:hypothetical protein
MLIALKASCQAVGEGDSEPSDGFKLRKDGEESHLLHAV